MKKTKKIRHSIKKPIIKTLLVRVMVLQHLVAAEERGVDSAALVNEAKKIEKDACEKRQKFTRFNHTIGITSF